MKTFRILQACFLFLLLPLCGKENKSAQPSNGKLPVKNEIQKFFPKAKLLKEDPTELQYMVTAGKNRFWLAIPTDKKINDLHFIFVFSGRGGSGKNNNINVAGIPEQFRKQMQQTGFAFICAVCSPNAWGDPGSTEATLAAIRYCRKQGINLPPKIDLLGFSMGGLGALMFAARHPEEVRKVTDVFGITDLEEFYKQGKYRAAIEKIPPAERQDRIPCAKIEHYQNIEFLIIHGDKDTTVSKSHSERFYALLQKQNIKAEFIIIPGIGHSNNILQKAGPDILNFFKK
ncbi:MAG: prolyl oligopeptidase family serine peptidase [Lentisphaeria bacterium]|nr:prolyl oligopeptidase family serine peptidase [Lentisphaeria bacterium]